MDPAQGLLAAAAASIRPLVALALIPLFSGSVMPAMIRNACVLAIVLPVAALHVDAPSLAGASVPWMLATALREAVIGVAIGLGFAAFLAGLQIVGQIIDHQTGLTFSQNVDPVSGNQVSVTSLLLERVLFTALLAGGALLAIFDTLYLSFEVWPLGRALPEVPAGLPAWLMASSGRLFALGLLLAGPVLFALFVVDVGVGMLNRAAPQLNVFGITQSVKSMVSLAVLMLALPSMIQRSLEAFNEAARAFGLLLRAGGT